MGQKFAVVDNSGLNPSFYDAALMAPPAGAHAITDAQWTEWLLAPTAYQWNGTTVVPYTPPPAAPVVPQQVTLYQAKAALFAQPGSAPGPTLLDDVNAWVASTGGLMAVAWASAVVVTRGGTFVAAAIAHFGWTGSFVDGLFEAAVVIVA